MSFNESLFREELDYIRRYGKILAQENPALESFLADKNTDLDVERLMEAFALLSAHLREKIEDEYPELTVPLIKRLCPNYLRSLPAMTIIEYTPYSRSLTTAVTIPRGEQVMNRQQGALKGNVGAADKDIWGPPACIFTLCRDIRLLPLEIKDIKNTSSLSQGTIDITLRITENAQVTAKDFNGITLWLGDKNECNRHQLYLWLSHYYIGAELIVGDHHYPQSALTLSPVGFNSQESLLPGSLSERDGYRILQEWLCYPDAFSFFSLNSAEFPNYALSGMFTLRLIFEHPLPNNLQLNVDALRLHCAPAVNIFVEDAVPFIAQASQRDYPLIVDPANPEHYAIFSIRSVNCQERYSRHRDKLAGAPLTINQNSLIPWESFEHIPEYYRDPKALYWRHITKASSLCDMADHFISLCHGDGSIPASINIPRESIQVSLNCTNRNQPCALLPGEINVPVGQKASIATFRNITVPTVSLPPVPDGPFHWSMLNTMSHNYLTLNDVEVLRDVLRTFDRRGIYEPFTARLSPGKLAALEKLETQATDRLFHGIPRRGLISTLYVNPQPFCCEGEIYLLGTVLSYFFALYASSASWHRLTLINTLTKEVWQWKERPGQFPTM